MPLPAALTLIPVHGQILKIAATGSATTPAAGTVSFRIEQTLRDTADNVLLTPTTITATLDATGSFLISLPATDDPDVTPQSWTYVVTITTDAVRDTWRISVPAATVGTLELADIAPAVAPSTLVTYVLASRVGQPGGVASLDAGGQVPAAQIPATGGAVSSVNGKTGTVTLSATDVSADAAGAASGAVTAHTGTADAHGDRAYADGQVATRVPSSSTVTSNPPAPLISHSRNFVVDQTSRNIIELLVNGVVLAWLNEWGGYRAQPAYAWDAVIRMIAHATQSGNIIEYQNNARTQVLWGVDAGGKVVQGNGGAAAVAMSPVYVVPASATLPADLPAGLPSGTVVIQLSS